MAFDWDTQIQKQVADFNRKLIGGRGIMGYAEGGAVTPMAGLPQRGGAIPGPVDLGTGDDTMTPMKRGEYVIPVEAVMAIGKGLAPNSQLSDEDALAIGKQVLDQRVTGLKQSMGNPSPPRNAGTGFAEGGQVGAGYPVAGANFPVAGSDFPKAGIDTSTGKPSPPAGSNFPVAGADFPKAGIPQPTPRGYADGGMVQDPLAGQTPNTDAFMRQSLSPAPKADAVTPSGYGLPTAQPKMGSASPVPAPHPSTANVPTLPAHSSTIADMGGIGKPSMASVQTPAVGLPQKPLKLADANLSGIGGKSDTLVKGFTGSGLIKGQQINSADIAGNLQGQREAFGQQGNATTPSPQVWVGDPHGTQTLVSEKDAFDKGLMNSDQRQDYQNRGVQQQELGIRQAQAQNESALRHAEILSHQAQANHWDAVTRSLQDGGGKGAVGTSESGQPVHEIGGQYKVVNPDTGEWEPMKGKLMPKTTNNNMNMNNPTEEQIQSDAKDFASGKLSPDLIGKGRNQKYMSSLTAEARKLYPNFDSNKAMINMKAQGDKNLIRSQENIKSVMDTAKLANQYIDAMHNGDLRLVNEISNRFAELTGEPAPTNWKTMAVALAQEFNRAYSDSTVNPEGRFNKELANVSAANSPEQLKQSIATNLAMTQVRADAVQRMRQPYSWDDVRGGAPQPGLKAKGTRDRFIQDEMASGTDTASQSAPIQGAKQAPDGKWYVTDPNRPGKYLQVEA